MDKIIFIFVFICAIAVAQTMDFNDIENGKQFELTAEQRERVINGTH